jgi:imidazolonepropionase-like amidohydrolase
LDWRRANYTLEELKAIVEEAHGAKRRVATHAHSRGVTLAVEAGIDDIEHGAEMEDRTIQMMKEKGTFYVPTLAVYAWMAQESWLPEPILSKSREITKEHIPSFKKALEAGVKIGLGTHNGMFIPHNQSAVELECLVKNGMTEMQAIVAATKTAAEVLGLEASLGTIQEGKIADLIVVNDNPL